MGTTIKPCDTSDRGPCLFQMREDYMNRPEQMTIQEFQQTATVADAFLWGGAIAIGIAIGAIAVLYCLRQKP